MPLTPLVLDGSLAVLGRGCPDRNRISFGMRREKCAQPSTRSHPGFCLSGDVRAWAGHWQGRALTAIWGLHSVRVTVRLDLRLV